LTDFARLSKAFDNLAKASIGRIPLLHVVDYQQNNNTNRNNLDFFVK